MSIKTITSNVSGLLPFDYRQFADGAQGTNVVPRACQTIETNGRSALVPYIDQDAVAGWIAEGQPIGESDPVIGTKELPLLNCAVLARVSEQFDRATASGSTQLFSSSLGRAISDRLDRAFLATTSPAPSEPSGLATLDAADLHEHYTGTTSWTNLDVFADVLAASEDLGHPVDSWIASPTDAARLAKIKEASDSNRALLGAGEVAPGQRTIHGIPLLVSRWCPTGTVYGLNRDRCIVAFGRRLAVEESREVFFTSYEVALRAVLSVNFAFLPDGQHRIIVGELVEPGS